MKKRIFYSISGVTLVSIALFNILISFLMYENLSNQQKDNIKIEISHISQALSSEDFSYDDMDLFTTSNRITLISSDGTVLYDNIKDSETLQNHITRPEVSLAINYGNGENIRLSDTLGEQTYYYALKLYDGNILRLSFTSSSIFAILYDSLPILISISILFVLFAIVLSSILTKYIIKPIDPKNPNIYDELLPFVKKIEDQQKYIDKQKYILEQKIIEFDATSKNIGDGLILLDSNCNILSINKRAKDRLGKKSLNYLGLPLINLTRNQDVQNAVLKAYNGEFTDTLITFKDKFYSFRISPVFQHNSVVGAVILIVDNTKNVEAEQIRREFSSNVSHELKTPLTSISGYAELIKSGFVQPCDIVPFAENIFTESQHLINLIEDIIKVSRLDEGQGSFKFEEINLKFMLENIISRLTPKGLERNIEISSSLSDISINGVNHVLNEIFYNIIENAIKYNVDNGTISIEMSFDNDFAIIKVRDTGIGIESSSIKRVFERFYRADTSHSKEIYGNGLGLSIVKHGVNLHNGKVEVSSKVDKGTVFTIYLKK